MKTTSVHMSKKKPLIVPHLLPPPFPSRPQSLSLHLAFPSPSNLALPYPSPSTVSPLHRRVFSTVVTFARRKKLNFIAWHHALHGAQRPEEGIVVRGCEVGLTGTSATERSSESFGEQNGAVEVTKISSKDQNLQRPEQRASSRRWWSSWERCR